MNRIFLSATTALLFLFIVSCNEESPFLTKEEARKQIDETNNARDPFLKIRNVVAILDNDIYYFDRLDSVPRRITNTPTKAKTYVKLSYDNSQIAYIDADGYPVIINATNGQLVKMLTTYRYPTSIDWVKDRNTLYILNNNNLNTYGEPLTPVQPQTTYPYPYDKVLSYSTNAIGDYAYIVKEYYGSSYYPKLYYRSESKNRTESSLEGERYDYVDFYDNKGGVLFGTTDSYKGGIVHVACVADYNFWPAYERTDVMRSPEFNGDLEVLLYATVNDTPNKIKAVYLGTELYRYYESSDILTKVFTKYTSKTPIYLDWNH